MTKQAEGIRMEKWVMQGTHNRFPKCLLHGQTREKADQTPTGLANDAKTPKAHNVNNELSKKKKKNLSI